MNRLLLLLSLLLTACSGISIPGISPTALPPPGAETTEPNAETYRKGEPVPFRVDALVYMCVNDPDSFSVARVSQDGQEYVLSLAHSCLGIAGSGVDQFCQDGQVQTTNVGSCTDAITCWEQPINQTLTWDQKAYASISEDCAGKTIHHEELQQVPEGKYRIRINMLQGGEIVTKVIKEFTILP